MKVNDNGCGSCEDEQLAQCAKKKSLLLRECSRRCDPVNERLWCNSKEKGGGSINQSEKERNKGEIVKQ